MIQRDSIMRTRLPFSGLFGALLILTAAVAQADEPVLSSSGLPQIEYVFETITVRGNDKTSERFFRRLLDLDPGTVVSVEHLDDFRRTLLSTGFFSDVETRLNPGATPGGVVVDIEVEERNSVLVTDIHLGISTDTPVWGGLELAETNLLGTEQGAGRIGIADPFGAAGVPLAWALQGYLIDGTWRGPSDEQAAGAEMLREEAFEYRRLGGRLAFGFDHLPPFTANLSYRAEAVDMRYIDRSPPHPEIGLIDDQSLLSSIGLTLGLDLRGGAQLPGVGFRAQVSVDAAGSYTRTEYELVSV